VVSDSRGGLQTGLWDAKKTGRGANGGPHGGETLTWRVDRGGKGGRKEVEVKTKKVIRGGDVLGKFWEGGCSLWDNAR